MPPITHQTQHDLPSGVHLFKATLIAFFVAAFLLVTTVIPAEYGIDPTGVGTRLGLTALSMAPAKPTTLAPTGTLARIQSPVWKRATPFRTDTQELTLQPDEGAEIKAKMQTGERFVFNWEAQGGPVNFDMHGEAVTAVNGEFTSYWKGVDQSNGHGAFEAPVEGTHGWYWRNRGDRPVTIRVTTSGYYEKLYKP